jgi:hypothetical protein
VDDVGIVDARPQLHLEGEYSPVVALDDDVNLVIAVLGPQMEGRGFCCLRADPDAQCHQGLEQPTEQCSGDSETRGGRGPDARDEGLRIDAQQAGGQARISEMMASSKAIIDAALRRAVIVLPTPFGPSRLIAARSGISASRSLDNRSDDDTCLGSGSVAELR